MSRRKREHNGRRTPSSANNVAVAGLGLSEESESRTVGTIVGGLPPQSSLVSYVRAHRLACAIVALALFTTTVMALKYLDEDAKRQNQLAVKDRSTFSAINPFVSAPLPSPTPQLSKELIYAGGGRLLAVEDANANAAPPADLAVWRPSNGMFYVLGGPGSQQTYYQWGTSGDIPVPGDFDGDGKTDFSVFRPSTGVWWVTKSSDNTFYSYQFGVGTDITAQADYDGDGKTDVAVWRATDGVWYIVQSSTGGVQYATYGMSGDKPAPADYDGDGRADIAVWRSTNNTFYSINSSNNAPAGFNFTQSSTEPVSADYDGDGKADYAIRNGNNWIIRNSSNPTTPVPIAWEQSTDKPVQNDYDGDGKVDIATWRDANGTWYIRQSGSNNSLRQVQWGIS
ncbi:MAG: FG-GAP repeat domain-containing protein, partial [Pyrinomonadaceae bacterium]